MTLSPWCIAAEAPASSPEAPPNTSWKFFPSVRASLLVPDHWYAKEEQRAGEYGVYITQESIQQKGWYHTGFSLSATRSGQKYTAEQAGRLAEQLIQKIEAAAKSSWEIRRVGARNVMPGYGGYFSQDTPDGEMTEYVITTVNALTGTTYIMIFESPSKSWKTDFLKGKVIMEKMKLDATF